MLADDVNTFRKYFGELGISKFINEFREFDAEVNDRGLVYVREGAKYAKSSVSCDSLILDDKSRATHLGTGCWA